MIKRTKNTPKRRIAKAIVPRFDDSPSYAGQYRTRITLPGLPLLSSSVITTGVVSITYGISTAAITGFATRFGSTFDEYRIVGARVLIRPVSASTGITVFWFDEKSTSAPTANEAQERVGLRLPNSNASDMSVRAMSWNARDLLDLNYTAIGSAVTPVTFKGYSDNASWGSPIAVTPLWVIEADITFEFKGLKST